MVCAIAAFLAFSALSLQNPGDQAPPPTPVKPKDFSFTYGQGFDVQVHLELVLRKIAEDSPTSLYCGNKCRGKKHIRHEDCDRSCDDECKTKHVMNFEVDANYVPPESYYTEFPQALQKLGVGVADKWIKDHLAPNLETDFNEFVAPIVKNPKLNLKRTYPHWCIDPCATSDMSFKFYEYDVVATWQVVRYDTGPDARQIPVKGPTGKVKLGYVMYLDPDTATPTKPYVFCRCKVVITEEERTWREIVEKHEKEEAERKAKEQEKPKDPPAGVKNPQTGMLLGPTDLEKCQFTVVCQDLDSAVCTATNPFSVPLEFCIDPGTLCVPSDSNYQTMVFCSQCKFTVPPKSLVTVPVALRGPVAAPTPAEGKAEIACLEMHKKEPNSDIKYTVDLPGDQRVTALAQVVNHEMFRGSWDQARFWIYTDHPSYEELSKRLIPSPGAGTFIRLMHDVHKVACADFTDAEYRPCITPDLLGGKGDAPSDAVKWFVGVCEEVDPQGLAAYVRSHGPDLAALLNEKSPETYVRRLAAIGSSMARSKNAEVSEAGLQFLKEAVPADARAEVARRGGLDGALAVLAAGDSPRCGAALDLVDLYGYVPAYPAVQALSKSVADSTLRGKAAALCAKLVRG